MLATEMNIPRLLVGELVERHGSYSKASRETKIPFGTLYDIGTGDTDPRFSTVEQIALALGYKSLDAALSHYRRQPNRV
jgi:predicted transcriptional regulator